MPYTVFSSNKPLMTQVTVTLSEQELILIQELLENNRNMDEWNSIEVYDSAIDKITTVLENDSERCLIRQDIRNGRDLDSF